MITAIGHHPLDHNIMMSRAKTLTTDRRRRRRDSAGGRRSRAHNQHGEDINCNRVNSDPRDFKKNGNKKAAIQKMVSFLESRGYDATSLNVKHLLVSGPSQSDFKHIMTFLFRRIDPTFNRPIPPGQRNNGDLEIKFEDEMIMSFKCCRYPFPICKTGLNSVGSPHIWPTLIAAIDWLVDLLIVIEAARDWELEEDLQEEELLLQTFQGIRQRSEKQWYQFLRKSMVSFLDNDQEESEKLECDLLDAFDRDNEKVEAYLNRMIEENEATALEIERLIAEVNK